MFGSGAYAWVPGNLLLRAGVCLAIVGLIGFAVLNGKTQAIEDDINEASVQILNLVVANRQKVNIAAVGQGA